MGTIIEINLNSQDSVGLPFIFRLREDGFARKDDENDITYTLSNPSDKYLLFLISILYCQFLWIQTTGQIYCCNFSM
jgi:hypothetical protein